jgi:hypothetical protein
MRSVVFILALTTGVAAVRGAEPSPEFIANLKRTLELRKQRRRAEVQAVGVIMPYPLPPTLIIRHRPEVHDEIEAFLNALRRSGG